MNFQTLENGSKVCPDDPGEPTTGVRRISVTREECALLSWLAAGRSVLELGTGLGVSTNAFLWSADYVLTIDPDPWVHQHVWPSLTDCEYRSERPAPDQHYASFVFIDADHQTAAVTEDIAYAIQVLSLPDGGMIVIHDAKMPEVAAALDDTWIHVDTHHGLAIKII